jgi:hypothetical protein
VAHPPVQAEDGADKGDQQQAEENALNHRRYYKRIGLPWQVVGGMVIRPLFGR